MVRLLLVGYDSETVDYSDPALSPGMAEKLLRRRSSTELAEAIVISIIDEQLVATCELRWFVFCRIH
jgi:hypothetical protein